MNILELAILKKMVGGGGGSGTDNYNDLSNLPQINGETLAGDKSSSSLGLQSEIKEGAELASDLVDDTNQDNKFVTSAEKLEWSGKQNLIDSSHKLSSDLVDDADKTNKFVTASEKETWNGKQNLIDNSHKLSSDLVDDANHTNKFVTSTEKETWNAKQNAIDSDHKLSSSLVSFSEAEAAALASGINSTKVDQISTNQTNILYVSNQIGKNVINARSYVASGQATGITVTVNDDCSVTLNGTSSSSNNIIYGYFDADVKPNTRYAMKGTGNSNVKVQLIGYNDINNPTVIFNDVNDNVGSSGNWQHYRIRLWIAAKPSSGTQFSNVTIYPMLCPEELWNISHDFAPYALPNYDLTRLESEDRAGLVECVDGGAKNKIPNIASSTTVGEAVFTVNSDGSVSVYTTAATTAARSLIILDSSKGITVNASDIVSGVPASASASSVSIEWGIGSSGNIDRVWGDNPDGYKAIGYSGSIRYVAITIESGKTIPSSSPLKFYPMICTKAAFGVSQKFVPYRPNYDNVIQKITPKDGTIFASYDTTITISNYYLTTLNGMAYFSLTAYTSAPIAAGVDRTVGYVAMLSAKSYNGPVIFTASVDRHSEIRCTAWMDAGNYEQNIWFRSEAQIPAGTNFYITGFYPCLLL